MAKRDVTPLLPPDAEHNPARRSRDENPRRRVGGLRPRARLTNPTPTQWYAIAGATALFVGVGAWWWTRRRRTSGSEVMPSGPRPKPQDLRHGTYVGDPKGPFAWPRDDLFPSVDAFGDVLERLGYDVGEWQSPDWSPLSGTTMSAVAQFQKDWNLYRAHIDDPWAPEIAANGKLDMNTVTALAGVVEAMQLGLDWPNTIYQLKSGEIS